MSGICGVVFQSSDERVELAVLRKMAGCVAASQEAGERVACWNNAGLGAVSFPGRLFGLAHARFGKDHLGLAFHGSLYNLCDFSGGMSRMAEPAQVLLDLYLAKGVAFVEKLRGEFAIAVWNGAEQTLYLFTDRFRIHPLLYHYDAIKIVFASRMRSIRACQLPLKCSVDPNAIVNVVASSVIPTPATIYQEVKKLPPGHFLAYRRGEVKVERYWDISFLNPSSSSGSVLAGELRDKLSEGVSIRLKADGAGDGIGAFLSGGVDSSTVSGVLTTLAKQPINCFSIGFAEQPYNEIAYARLAAKAVGARLHEYFVSPKDVVDTLSLMLRTFDEPYANASAVPTLYCAKLARQHGIRTLYAGDGGDELFAGNERYAVQRLFDYYGTIPLWLRNAVVEPLVNSLADFSELGLLQKVRKYVRRASIPYPDRLRSWGVMEIVPAPRLFSDGLLVSAHEALEEPAPISEHYFRAPAITELDRQLYIDLKLAISDNDLFKVTRMTECVGVNARFPLLDHVLAEFAGRVPASKKMRGMKLRTFFKEAYADLLPPEVRAKPKHGFGLPIPLWLRTDPSLSEMMRDLVLSPTAVQRGYFKKACLEDLVRLHQEDTTSFYGTILWNLMILELWHREHLDNAHRDVF